MAIIQRKYDYALMHGLRDTRPLGARAYDFWRDSMHAMVAYIVVIVAIIMTPVGNYFSDLLFILMCLYAWWLAKVDRTLCYKMPIWSKYKDGNERDGKAQGILFMGNSTQYEDEEIWFSNSDVRTHILYLGTTGAGKTEGLKSIVTNALMWGSGFIYVDGKADTDLWSSMCALVRRFGRDDDMLVLNYMTGNSDEPAPSNTLNPFSSGSASYLTNMLVSLMPEAGGDNAMWKERAVSLLSSLMPALTWKRDHQEMPLSINTIRNVMNFPEIIKLSRDTTLPDRIREGLKGYLDTLPGYVDDAFDDNGMEKPLGPDQPMVDTNVVKQQHGYLTMQFTRALQSLGNDYGYIFEAQNADIDMIDVVLNRRIMIVLIPALEKSSDEAANLGKIVAATLKGMMGSTLGASVEGESATVIENKPTRSSTPFITVFDEVGYYTTQGMGVMAAQARSLGFCLVYAAQDLAALEKRVKEEAKSITGNCNIKIFGKLEDPMGSQDFFERTIGKALVSMVSGFALPSGGSSVGSYLADTRATNDFRGRSSFDELKSFKEGEAILVYAITVNRVKIFYANPGTAKAMRVQRFMGLPKPDDFLIRHLKDIAALRDRLMSKKWTAKNAEPALPPEPEIAAIAQHLSGFENTPDKTRHTALSIVAVQALSTPLDEIPAQTLPPAGPAANQREAISHGSGTQSQTPSGTSSADAPMKWSDLLHDTPDDDDDNDAQDYDDDLEDDEDDETTSSGGSGSSARKPADIQDVPDNRFDSTQAVDARAKTGVTMMPEGLSDEVKTILKSAADNIAAGLLGTPELERSMGGSSDSRTVKPANAPTSGSPMKR